MHIVLDCRYAFPHLSGIGRYITDLARAIANHPDRPERVSVLTPDPDSLRRYLDPSLPLTPLVFPHPPTAIKAHRALRKLLREVKADLFHAPDALAPFFAPCPVVLTIHDLIPLACRDFGPHGLKARFAPLWRAWQKAQCRQASLILTDSIHSQNDIAHYLSPKPSKVRIIYPGLRTPTPPTPANQTALMEKLHISPKGFLLYVGRRDPYKNITGVIRALGLLKGNHPALKLVIAGYPDPRFPEPEQEITRLNLKDRVIVAGHLTDDEISTLYYTAAVTVLLSYYEGFGYPVLESQLRSTPVLSSPLTSLPEVGGDAALYADPRNDQEVASKLHDILATPELRESMVSKGLANVRRFTPEAQAEQTLLAYRSVLKTAAT